MDEINLTYCPEGGEHEWVLWNDQDEAALIIDCDRCHTQAYRGDFPTASLHISPLPVKLDNKYLSTGIEADPRREV